MKFEMDEINIEPKVSGGLNGLKVITVMRAFQVQNLLAEIWSYYGVDFFSKYFEKEGYKLEKAQQQDSADDHRCSVCGAPRIVTFVQPGMEFIVMADLPVIYLRGKMRSAY